MSTGSTGSTGSTVRLLILGASGMLGQAAVSVVRGRNLAYRAAARSDLDLTATDAVDLCLADGFDAVVNCAAFTAVDECETNEELAMEVNGHAVGRLASVCARRGVALVHVSSDYVFSGEAPCPAQEARPYMEEDPIAPASAYGRSKELGERLALEQGAMVVRASWLFGPGGPNFVATMLRLADRGEPVRVVNDQIGCPTYTVDLADALIDLLMWAKSVEGSAGLAEPPRLFHFASPSPVSWFGFAQAVFDVFEKRVELYPCATDDFPRPAPRPAYSVLSSQRMQETLGREFRGWRSGLAEYRSLLKNA